MSLLNTREEAVVMLGMSLNALNSGLATARTKLKEFGSEVGGNIGKSFAGFGAAFTGGALLAGISHVLEKFDELQDRAENLSIGTDFLQGMQYIASQDVVGGAEKFNKSIEQLNVNLGQLKSGDDEISKKFRKWKISMEDIAGLDTEQVFYLIADRIKAIPNPAEQAAAAFDLMGKAGKNMSNILAQGSVELHKMVDEVDKLDEDKIKELADAQHKIGEIGNKITVGAGTLIGWVTHDLPNWLGRTAGGGTTDEPELRAKARAAAKANHQANLAAGAERTELQKQRAAELQKIYDQIGEVNAGDAGKLMKLEREALDIEKQLKDAKLDDVERAQLLLKLAQKNSEYNKESLEQEKKKADAKQAQLDKEQQLSDAKKKARRDELEEFLPSIDELRHSRTFGRDARQIQRLERDARRRVMRGDVKGYTSDVDERNRIYDRLADMGIVKHRSSEDKIADATERTARAIEKITTRLSDHR